MTRRYKVLKKIGRGCYGVVWEVLKAKPEDDEWRSEREGDLALKKVLYAWGSAVDAQRTYREVSYLLALGDHENILSVRDVLVAPNDSHLYLVTDLYACDVQKALTVDAIREVHRPLIAYQVMRALKYIHSASVMHRDVKPSNILLRCNGEAVLADFGWARSSPEIVSAACPLTEYAATRWYRAPEMLFGGRMYTTAVDLWALGCVIAELHLKWALLPGTSTLDMVTRIEDLLGKPLDLDVVDMEAPYAGLAADCVLPGPPHIPLEALFIGDDPDSERLLDILKLLLQYNPKKRLLATEALEHPYVGAFHNPDAEPVREEPVVLRFSDDEKVAPSRYRDQLYADVVGLQGPKLRVEDEERQRLVYEGGDNEDV